MIYPMTYAASLAALALWFAYRNDEAKSKLLQTGFFVALASFIASVAWAEAAWADKLGVLFRDLLVLAAFGMAFQFLSSPRRLLPVGLAAAALLLVYHQAFMAQSLKPGRAVLGSEIRYDPDGELLLELAEGASLDALAVVVNKYRLTLSPAFSPESTEITELDDYYLVDIPVEHEGSMEQIVEALQGLSVVDWVEPNEIIELSPLPASPSKDRVKKAFGLNDPAIERLWGFDAMRIDELFEYLEKHRLRPVRKALIAILDTGVDAKHQDLQGNFRSIRSDFDDDPMGHGTHCAGIAGAVSNNQVGIASFSKDNAFVEITSVKVLSRFGSGTQKTIIDGIILAADQGADVLSLSLGGPSDQVKERAYRKAVDYANKKGAIVVVAAGNSNRDAKNYAPAGVPGVIAVSALDEQLNRASFSNHVANLDRGIAAPGVNIYSTIPNDKYTAFNGTSMATPYVAGLLGLLKSLDPDLDTERAYRILQDTGRATGNTAETGYLIQPGAAVKALAGK
jgi:thermitase